MKVEDEGCMTCLARHVECWWVMGPTLRLCRECYFDKFGVAPA